MELTEFALIIGLTSAITTGGTTVIVIKTNDMLKNQICNQITDLLIRVGVLEEKHRNPV